MDQTSNWDFFSRVVQPALDLAPTTFLEDISASLSEAGIQEAVARHDSRPIYDWLLGLFQLQGISDAVAFSYTAKHGTVRWAEIEGALASSPDCHRLNSYWHFADCKYQKGARICSEPHLLHRCHLPRHPLRNGRLSQAAYSLFFFIRDICDGDLVGWIDRRLESADPGPRDRSRAVRMRHALLEPMGRIFGVSNKVLSMVLADLLLVGDPSRERWVTTGGSMIAIDSLMHNLLHRTGVLHRFGAMHEIGPACYLPGSCASLIEGLARRIDAHAYNPLFPSVFPRFIQHSLWSFCAGDKLSICNGNRIDDTARCRNQYCPAFDDCDRVSLRGIPSGF
ncbi:hypothetical protein [Microvirga solisilvae]|uniref:hypothetical protein n=1 Tax=Microvirga solisilvae TaxID=2919498 RepID=UPI002434294D|nr:hypothetical protein [Microvirga solisilvae]